MIDKSNSIQTISIAILQYIADNYIAPQKPNQEEQGATIHFSLSPDEQAKPPESFKDMLHRFIAESGMADPQVYKKAHVSRSTFCKINNMDDYLPSKETVICLAIALELDIKNTNALLEKVGYVLSKSYKRDLAITGLIENKIYDFFTINEVLYNLNPKWILATRE